MRRAFTAAIGGCLVAAGSVVGLSICSVEKSSVKQPGALSYSDDGMNLLML